MRTVMHEQYDGAAGSCTAGTQWIEYLSTQVMPVLNGLMRGASENDESILHTIYGILQGTVNPEVDTAETVRNLWTTYNTVYRPSLQSTRIPVTTDQTLYRAKQYVESHR